MYRDLETETANQWATACRSFLIGHESELYQETQKIYGREEKLGLPTLLLSDISELSYSGISTGLERRTQTPAWQILLRSQNETALLHGRVTRTAEDWRLLYEDRQGIKSQEAFVIDDCGKLADFVLLALEKADINKLSKKLLDEKSEARRKHDEYVRGNPQGIDKAGQRINGSARLFGQYSRIKFNGFEITDLRHVRRPDVPKGTTPKKVDFRDLPRWISDAVGSTSFKAEVPYVTPHKITKKR